MLLCGNSLPSSPCSILYTAHPLSYVIMCPHCLSQSPTRRGAKPPGGLQSPTSTPQASPALWAVTSLLCGHHQSFSSLSPAFPGLGRDAEQVDRLWLEAGGHVLAGAGCQDLHRGGVGCSGIEPVCDLVGCREERQRAMRDSRVSSPSAP